MNRFKKTSAYHEFANYYIGKLRKVDSNSLASKLRDKANAKWSKFKFTEQADYFRESANRINYERMLSFVKSENGCDFLVDSDGDVIMT